MTSRSGTAASHPDVGLGVVGNLPGGLLYAFGGVNHDFTITTKDTKDTKIERP